jgi:hypothetical protein
MPSASDGVLVGIAQNLSLMACMRCDHVAVPLEFEDEASWLAFKQAQSGKGGWTRVG